MTGGGAARRGPRASAARPVRGVASPAARRAIGRAPTSTVDARRSLDLALDLLLEASGAREGLVALVPERGRPEVRLTPGLQSPDPRDLSAAARRLLEGRSIRPVLRGLGEPVEGAAVEVGDGTVAVAVAVGAVPGAGAAAAPGALLPVVRAELLLDRRRRSAEMARLHATAQSVASSLDLEQMLAEIVRDAVELLGADSGDMLLRDPGRPVLRVVAVANFADDMVGFEMGLDEGLSARAMATQRPVQVADYLRSQLRVRRLDRYGFRAVLCVPLVARGESIGTLNVHATDPGIRFGREDVELLVTFANHAAIAIDNARRLENEARLARDLQATAEELSRSLGLQQRLAEQVLLDRGLPGIAEELATILGRPVAIQDQLLRAIGGASPPGESGWEALVIPREGLQDPATATFLRELAAGGRAAETPPELGGDRLVVPIRSGGETVLAYLVVASGPDPAPLDRALIEVASTGVALELAKQLARVEVEQRLTGDVVGELLAGPVADPAALSTRAARLGIDLSEPRDVMVLHVEADGAGTDAVRRCFETVHGLVRRESPASLVALQGGVVVVLAARCRPERGGFGERPAEVIAGDLVTAAGDRLSGLAVTAAVGDRCADVADYPRALELALA
ncbi:MAG: GAF domain-containing protein, partial [Actinobacteria bacterium]|nr:GAF domain-containing protein [Actinomycetota bacterium]